MRWYNETSNESLLSIFSDVELFSYLEKFGFIGRALSYILAVILIGVIGLIFLYNIPSLLLLAVLFSVKKDIKIKKISLVKKIFIGLSLTIFSTLVYLLLNLFGFSGSGVFY